MDGDGSLNLGCSGTGIGTEIKFIFMWMISYFFVSRGRNKGAVFILDECERGQESWTRELLASILGVKRIRFQFERESRMN